MTSQFVSFSGVWVALVTPFRNGRLDEAAFQNLVADLAARGVAGFVPLGSTGESPTVTAAERRRIIALCVEAAGRLPVCPGCGTYDTAHTIEQVREAEQMGAKAAMIVVPYYNKPTPEGQIAHFRAVADATELPLMLYNIPSRTGVNMLPETIERLCAHPRLAAVKEASGNIEQISDLCTRVGDRIRVLSGDDSMTLPVLAVGGAGVVSVAAHLAAEPLVEMVNVFRTDPARALALHRKLAPLCKALFLESNPAPVKAALALEGKIANELRLPLVPVREETRDRIAQLLREFREGKRG